MKLDFSKALGIFLSITIISMVLAGVTVVAKTLGEPVINPKPAGLISMETMESREIQQLITEVYSMRSDSGIEIVPPIDPDAPPPGATRLYNNLLENLLSSLHYFYRNSDENKPSEFVTSWDANSGGRVMTDARLLSIENNVNYLLALETYRKMHAKAVFDDDLEYARSMVHELFSEEWHTNLDWPLGVYFDLVELYDVTGDEQYLDYAGRYAAGESVEDTNTPLWKARTIAVKYQGNYARTASPFHFLHAALLADWGSRNDPSLMSQARAVFQGLAADLLDSRFNLLAKQASTSSDGSSSRNLIQTFDTLEQLTAIRGMLIYGKASGDPAALSLARQLNDGIWGMDSVLLVPAPEGVPENAFYGMYTAYDLQREATRMVVSERTIDHILFFDDLVSLNELTRGEYRSDVDFMASWLENTGPMFRKDFNGYLAEYTSDWQDPEEPFISAKAAIWMARALTRDEWYRFQRTGELVVQQPQYGE